MSNWQHTRALLVVARHPVPGQTKTRLCPLLGSDKAAQLAACFLHDTLEIMRQVPDVTRTIVYTPDNARDDFHTLAPDMHLLPQRGANLGERLVHAFDDAFALGAHQVVIMDSDSPTLPPAYVAEAFAALDGTHGTHDTANHAVFGPCDDGGYYLVGLQQPCPRLFLEVTMSTPDVLRDTLRLAATLGRHTTLLPAWYDVDTPDDVRRLWRELAGSNDDNTLPAPAPARHTRAFVARVPLTGL